jgi:hypothetical protein
MATCIRNFHTSSLAKEKKLAGAEKDCNLIKIPCSEHASQSPSQSRHTNPLIPSKTENNPIHQPPYSALQKIPNLIFFLSRDQNTPPLPLTQTLPQHRAASTRRLHPAPLTPSSTPADPASEAGAAVSTMEGIPVAVGVAARR